MLTPKPPFYCIYLLTVWQEHGRGPPEAHSWRFRLEDPRSGRQQLFADVDALMKALHHFADAEDTSQEQAKEG